MKFELVQKNYNATDRFLSLIDKKLEKLHKFLADNDKLKMNLSKASGDNYTMEITIYTKNKIVRSEVVSKEMWDNIDIIIPKLEKQLVKLNSKSNKRTVPSFSLSEEAIIEESAKDNWGKLVREKSFDISIITPEQAIHELELLDHDFYIFVNANNNKVSVLYKRLDKNYGLITPEY